MKVVIMRGLSGAGKSTWIEENLYDEDDIYHEVVICSADHFHIKDGKYLYNQADARRAHDACLRKFLIYVEHPGNQSNVRYLVVDNTNLATWEISPYYRLAEMFGVEVEIVRVECDVFVAAKRNVHSVPIERVFVMHQTLRSERLPSHWKERIIISGEMGHWYGEDK